MADADGIYKTLRLVPDFDGNPHILPRFIQLCDQIVAEYLEIKPDNNLAKLCLLNGILNKITGQAAQIINSNGIPEDWTSIKKALINNFSDQRDETTLYNDLMLATQGNSSPQEFYDRCVTLFCTIMTYVTLHETIDTTIEAKRTLYKKLTMQAFVRGLKEPLGSRVRCMRPDSVEKALEFVQEELNVMYLLNRSDPYTERKTNNSQKMLPVPSAPKFVNPAQNQFNSPLRATTVSNFQPPQQIWKPNMFHNNPQYTHRPSPPGNPLGMQTRTQQIFRAPPPNYNRFNNNFQMQPRSFPQSSTGPKPMSGVSHYVARDKPRFGQISGHDWRKSGNPPPSNYFKSQEMNTNECAYFDEQYYYPDCFNEPHYDSYIGNTEYYNIEPTQYTIEEPGYNNYVDCQPYQEPQPGSTSQLEQDFQTREILDKSK